MKKQKSMNNKGFSLVELIIVIAIMAILIGVMAPQLLRYVERTRVSADTQVADSVRSAVTYAMLDPAVIAANDGSVPAAGTVLNLSQAADFPGAFGAAVAETLGYADVATMTTGIIAELQSDGATGITATVAATGNNVTVEITGSDDGSGNPITVE